MWCQSKKAPCHANISLSYRSMNRRQGFRWFCKILVSANNPPIMESSVVSCNNIIPWWLFVIICQHPFKVQIRCRLFSEWINLESSSNIAPPDTNDRASGYEIFVESSLFKVSFVASNGFLAVSQGNAIPSTLASFDGDHYQTAIQTIFLFLSWRW